MALLISINSLQLRQITGFFAAERGGGREREYEREKRGEREYST